MNQNIATLKTELVQMVEAANDLPALEQARVTALGKKGRITDLMRQRLLLIQHLISKQQQRCD